MLADGAIEAARDARYAGWGDGMGADILAGNVSLGDLADRALNEGIDPAPVSGRQEHLENEVNRIIWGLD